MANAKKCDRCGEFYEQRLIDCLTINSPFIKRLDGSLRVYEDNSTQGFYFDLCPTCFKELIDFLHIKEVEEGDLG